MFLKISISFSGISCICAIFQTDSQLTMSNAFSKSIKLLYKSFWNSGHCSMMFLWVKICSQHDRSFLNLACSYINCGSMVSCSLFNIIAHKIFPGTGNKVIHRQFPHFDRSPFLGSLTMIPFLHSSGTNFHFYLLLVYLSCFCFPINL